MDSKIEQLALEISENYHGGAKLNEGDVVTDSEEIVGDPSIIIPLIVDAIIQIIKAWSENCGSLQPFSRIAKRPGFLAKARARSVIKEQIYHHRATDVRVSDVWRSSQQVIAQKTDAELDEIAREPRRPDWGI